MTNPAANSGNSLGSEDSILARIDRHFARRRPGIVLGRGDDCAELRLDSPFLAVSSDIFLENAHFRRGYFTPEEIGHKALAVNLSDLAAAGARPLGFVLNLMLPPDLPADELEGILSGMGKLAEAHELPLCGGDLSRARPGQLGFAITIWGGPAGAAAGILPDVPTPPRAASVKGVVNGKTPQAVSVKNVENSDAAEAACSGFEFTKSARPGTTPFLRRGQAQAGDYIFLIGEIGLARAGLLSLEELYAPLYSSLYSFGQPSAPASHTPAHSSTPTQSIDRAVLETTLPHSLQAHLRPQPQIQAGLALARFKQAHPDRKIGLMDLSDGLYRDLPRLLGMTADFSNNAAHRNKASKMTASDNGGETVKGAPPLGAALHIKPGDLHPELTRWVSSRGSLPYAAEAGISSELKFRGDISPELSHDLAIALVEHACQGGEDYALIGTCPPECWERLNEYAALSGTEEQNSRNGHSGQEKQDAAGQSFGAKPGWDLKKIGVVTAGGGISVNGVQAGGGGFDHFS